MEVSDHGTERVDFEQLFVEHAPFAWRVLRRFGVAESDLPDACQDAFIVVHRKLGEFEGRSNLRTWLYRICARVASDYRKRAHRRYETEPLTQEPAVAGDQLRTAELIQLCALLERALDGLDDDKRQVFVLYELEDLSMAQVAELLDCPIKTAFSRLYVARDRVNALLRRAGCAALIIPLDPLPMRELAQAPLASALDATGVATPNAAQLTALASKFVGTSASMSAYGAYVLLSSGALAVAAAFALTFATAPLAPMASMASMARVHEAKALTDRITSLADEPAVHVPELAEEAFVAVDPVKPPSRTRARASVARAPKQTTPPAEETSVSAEWIEAPSATQPAPVAPAAVPSTGLDEVLSATSIRSLMRVGPPTDDDASHEQWALIALGNGRSPAVGNTATRRASIRR